MEVSDEINENIENISDKENKGEVSDADKVNLNGIGEISDEIIGNNDYSDGIHNNGEASNAGKNDENIVDMENMRQEKVVERHQEDEQAPRRSARNKAKP